MEISICLRLLGANPQTLTGALPLDPAEDFRPPDSLFCSPVATPLLVLLQCNERRQVKLRFSLAIFCSFIVIPFTRYRRAVGQTFGTRPASSRREEVLQPMRGDVSSCAKMAAASAPRQANASAATPLLFAFALLARQLSFVVVVVVFEVARGRRRSAAGTLTLSLVCLHGLAAIILHKPQPRTHVFNPRTLRCLSFQAIANRNILTCTDLLPTT